MKRLFIFILIFAYPTLGLSAITFIDGKWVSNFDCAEILDTGLPGFDWGCDDISEGSTGFTTQFNLSDGSTNQWTQSTAYPDQYYYSGSLLVAPNEAPSTVSVNGAVIDYGLPFDLYEHFSPLSAGQGSYEDVDSLGSNHVYIYSLVDPDTQADGYVVGWFSHSSYYTGDKQTGIIEAANNPLDTTVDSKAVRFYRNTGSNKGTSSMSIVFSSAEPEIWFQWHARYEEGFNWESIVFDKTVTLFTGEAVKQFAGFGSGFSAYAVVSQTGGASYTYPVSDSQGWDEVMGARTSDGKYHSYQVHLKMDTGTTDGTAIMWVDGVLWDKNENAFLSYDDALGGSNPAVLDGWALAEFDSNQSRPDNLEETFVDWDNMTIIVDPNHTDLVNDGNGNLFIPPIVAPPSGAISVSNTGTNTQSLNTGTPWTIGN